MELKASLKELLLLREDNLLSQSKNQWTVELQASGSGSARPPVHPRVYNIAVYVNTTLILFSLFAKPRNCKNILDSSWKYRVHVTAVFTVFKIHAMQGNGRGWWWSRHSGNETCKSIFWSKI